MIVVPWFLRSAGCCLLHVFMGNQAKHMYQSNPEVSDFYQPVQGKPTIVFYLASKRSSSNFQWKLKSELDSPAVHPTSGGLISLGCAGWKWHWTLGRAWCFPQSHETLGTDPTERTHRVMLKTGPAPVSQHEQTKRANWTWQTVLCI